MKAPKYCELKRQTYYAVLKIPKDLVCVFNKTKFIQSTKTGDPKLAEERAMQLVGKWKGWIRDARVNGLNDLSHPFHLEEAVMALRNAQSDDEYESLVTAHEEFAYKLYQQGQVKAAKAWFKASSSSDRPLKEYLNDWVNERLNSISAKNRTQRQADIKFLFKQFLYVESISKDAVLKWIRKLHTPIADNGLGKSPHATSRILSTARIFWDYLHDRGVVSGKQDVFDTPKYLLNLKENNKKPNRKAFTPEEATRLYRESLKNNDEQLSQLIILAMFTGARLDELCELNTKSSSPEWLNIEKSKTKAGIRKVPVHPTIKPLVEKLIAQSKDGFLISGLKSSTGGKRSNAIGKRFGRLKRKLGFEENKVFHSFRRTAITQLQENGVSPDLISALVGHKADNFSIKNYSDATLKARKIEAISTLKYPDLPEIF